MLGASLKVEIALNFLLRGINAASGIYLATEIDPQVAALFAYVSAVNILKSIDFGYNFYQRHLILAGFRLSAMSASIFLILPVCCFIWIIPDDLIATALELGFTCVVLKYIGTYANIINKTWLIALPLSSTLLAYMFIDKSIFKETLMLSAITVMLIIYWKYSSYKLEKNLRKMTMDWKLMRSALLVFIPSFLFLLLSEYMFVYYQDELTNYKWVAVYLKINATLISIIFLFNDLYWNRFGYKEWPWLWSRVSHIIMIISLVLIIAYPSVITLLLGSILSSIISGYYIRQKFVSVLFIAGLAESLCFFGGLMLLELSNYFLIVAITVSVKILITYYGKTIFNLSDIRI